jgi:hypothetical protein
LIFRYQISAADIWPVEIASSATPQIKSLAMTGGWVAVAMGLVGFMVLAFTH